jgi:hypothetical protein
VLLPAPDRAVLRHHHGIGYGHECPTACHRSLCGASCCGARISYKHDPHRRRSDFFAGQNSPAKLHWTGQDSPQPRLAGETVTED